MTPAFPTPVFYEEKPIACESGMDLRDYFAAHAPPMPSGWDSTRNNDDPNKPETWGDNAAALLVEWRWYYADLMLEARRRK